MTRPSSCAPIPTQASKGKVHAFAEDAARRLGFQPGDAIEPLVRNLGGTISYLNPFTNEGHAPPSIFVNNSRSFTIFLPVTTSPRRNRFTIAHELGHLFLHFPMVQKETPGASMTATRWVDEADPQQQRAEWEANWFAAGFLMPHERFGKLAVEVSNSSAALAKVFDVSEQAVRIQGRYLGIAIS